MNAAVVLTPPLSSEGSAIAVVRLRGQNVGEFLKHHFSRPAVVGHCVHGELRDGAQVIDDPIIVLGDNGSWADICLHGGPWVVAATLQLAARADFQIVEDLPPLPDVALDEAPCELDCQVLAHLPLARTDLALRVLLEQPQLWAAGVANFDIQTIHDDWSLWWLLHPPQVAIIGEPNVGKSTLANQLFGQEHSITADWPGTTRDWVGETANIDGLAVRLIDTPGIHQTADPIESAAIATAAEQIESSDLVLVVLDATQMPSASIDRPGAVRIINKCDQSPAWDFAALDSLEISAKDGRGIDELRRRIARHFGIETPMPRRPRWWTKEQRRSLRADSNMRT